MIAIDVPNLDCATTDDLFEFARCTQLLSLYAHAKAAAEIARLAGEIEHAMGFEESCDEYYSQLPPEWRW